MIVVCTLYRVYMCTRIHCHCPLSSIWKIEVPHALYIPCHACVHLLLQQIAANLSREIGRQLTNVVHTVRSGPK